MPIRDRGILPPLFPGGRKQIVKNLTSFTLPALALVLIAGCGEQEKAQQTELISLREQVRTGNKEERVLLNTKREAVTLRGQLHRLADDDLRHDTESLELRLQNTGTRIGLHKVRRLVREGLKRGDGDLNWRLYRLRIRGHNDVLQRWLRDMVSWPVGISPMKLVSQKDAIGNFEHEYTFAIPEWELPEKSPSPGNPPDPSAAPEGAVAYEIWQLRQNVARIEEARKVLPAIRAERDALQSLMDQVQGLGDPNRAFVDALDAVLRATKRSGSLQGYSIEPHQAEVTAVLLSENALQSYLGYLESSPSFKNAEEISTERTKLGLRCVVQVELARDGE